MAKQIAGSLGDDLKGGHTCSLQNRPKVRGSGRLGAQGYLGPLSVNLFDPPLRWTSRNLSPWPLPEVLHDQMSPGQMKDNNSPSDIR
jgi:hypothetical protein